MNQMQILFAGSAPFALPTLKLLHDLGIVCAVLTAPDRPSGRGLTMRKNCIAEFATNFGLPLIQPETLRSEARELVASYYPDIMICAAYGKIFGPKFLSLFPRGTVNIHPSLLPRFRGPAPVSATLLAGDKQTGITLQKMALEMDAGDVIVQSTRDVKDEDTVSYTHLTLPTTSRV